MICRVCGKEMKLLEVLENKEKDVTTLYRRPYTGNKQNLELYRCNFCTHMQIAWMNSPDYYEDYTLISDITEDTGKGKYTPSLLRYNREKIEQLARYARNHDRILDIGCGAGVLMELEEEFFGCAVGVEPSKIQYDIAIKQGRDVLNAYFSRELKFDGKFSAFITTQVFEHITTIRETLEYAYDLLEAGGVGLVEVPNGQKVYYEQCYYDIFTDHVNYFTPLSLCTLANSSGFEVISISEEFNRNHMSLYVRKPVGEKAAIKDAVAKDKVTLNNIIKGYSNISVWGCGAKARSFIQLMEKRSYELIHIWDVNALTWNQYLDSVNVPITAPDEKSVNESDLILIFAAAYTEEIISDLRKKFHYKGDVVRFDGGIRLQHLSGE